MLAQHAPQYCPHSDKNAQDQTTSHCREAQDARTAPSWAAVLGAACCLGQFQRLDPTSHQEQCGNQRVVTSLRLHH